MAFLLAQVVSENLDLIVNGQENQKEKVDR